ncbi:hypothetical protein, partial [Bosea sp. ASV33]|uniref:hypothetical protein n=1 Tax=Bosea sp. ASV33 TaxID=2795106 RepID=UPI001AEE1B9C
TGDGNAAGTGSFTVALVHAAALRSLAVERGGTPAAIETRFGPVSYTHLTLPTINLRCRSRWAPDH